MSFLRETKNWLRRIREGAEDAIVAAMISQAGEPELAREVVRPAPCRAAGRKPRAAA